jgi:hypothetical protein
MRMRPSKRMSKSRVLTPAELIEVDHVLREQVLVFPRQTDIMQPGVVRTDRDVDPGGLAPVEDRPQRGQIAERACLEVRRGTYFQALAPVGHLPEQIGIFQSDLNPVTYTR